MWKATATAITALALVALAILAPRSVVAKDLPYRMYERPVSSHDVNFWLDLLEDRVTVLNLFGKSRRDLRGFYAIYRSHAILGRGMIAFCKIGPDGKAMFPGRVAEDPIRASVLTRTAGGPKWNRIPFYKPATGEIVEYTREETDDPSVPWTIGGVSWVQNAWPVIAKEACPDLPIPDTVPINNKQTSPILGRMRMQDPDARIRNFESTKYMASLPYREWLNRLPERDGEVWQCGSKGSQCTVFMKHSELWTRGSSPDRTWFYMDKVSVDWNKNLIHLTQQNGEVWTRSLDNWSSMYPPNGEREPVADWLDAMAAPGASAVPFEAPEGIWKVRFYDDLTADIEEANGSRTRGSWSMDYARIIVRDDAGEERGNWDALTFDTHLRRAGIL